MTILPSPKYKALLRGLLLLPLLGSTPVLEELRVSHRYMTVLVFDTAIEAVDLSSGAYAAKIRGHLLLLRSLQPKAPTASLLVTCQGGGGFLHARLCYANQAPQTYDFRTGSKAPQEGAPAPASSSEVLAPAILAGVSALKSAPQAYRDIGLRSAQLVLILTNILSDQEHLYLKLFVANDSSLSYRIGAVEFSLTQAQRERVALSPLYAEVPEQICAYGAE
ncbi:MAG: hypothetical protein AAFQ08_03105, partial [Bacteroidota bacterium]